jgi:hypothetical protein
MVAREIQDAITATHELMQRLPASEQHRALIYVEELKALMNGRFDHYDAAGGGCPVFANKDLQKLVFEYVGG